MSQTKESNWKQHSSSLSVAKTDTKTIKRKNLTLVHTTTVTSEDYWKSQLLFGLHITEMTLWGGVLAVLKIKNGYRQCCFVFYLLKILKSLIFYRVVTKISSCRVNTTSRRGIKRLGISFGSIFLLFSNKSSWGPLS